MERETKINMAVGFIRGTGRTLADPIGTVLGKYCDKKGKKAFFIGRHYDHYKYSDLSPDDSSLEFRVAKRVGDVMGLSIGLLGNALTYGLPQICSMAINIAHTSKGRTYEDFA